MESVFETSSSSVSFEELEKSRHYFETHTLSQPSRPHGGYLADAQRKNGRTGNVVANRGLNFEFCSVLLTATVMSSPPRSKRKSQATGTGTNLVLVYTLEGRKCLFLHPLAQLAQFPKISRVGAPRPREQLLRLVRELCQHRGELRLEQRQHLRSAEKTQNVTCWLLMTAPSLTSCKNRE